MSTVAAFDLGEADTIRLIAALSISKRAVAREAAAAIQWNHHLELAPDRLEPDFRNALIAALATIDQPSTGLAQLHAVLRQETRTDPTVRRIRSRLHNPRRLSCECLSDCWCRRTTWGKAVRWYIPSRYHSPIAAAGSHGTG